MNDFSGVVEAGLVDGEDYQALTEREEMDLEQLMTQCGSAVSNAEAFMETLARDLSILDGVWLHLVIFNI